MIYFGLVNTGDGFANDNYEEQSDDDFNEIIGNRITNRSDNEKICMYMYRNMLNFQKTENGKIIKKNKNTPFAKTL